MTFARHGVPECVISDNGPAYASEEFKRFAEQWEFQHVTTSPHYPQSNGKAESAVKTCKTLMKKAKLARSDLQLALLNHRNTLTEPTNFSPAQRLFGRRTQTLLLSTTGLLTPETPHRVPAKLGTSQRRQRRYYNRNTKSLPLLQTGDIVRLKLPGSTIWTPAVCKKQVAPRSYIVECNGHYYRRNRRHLRKDRANVTRGQQDADWEGSDTDEGEEEEESNMTLTEPNSTGPHPVDEPVTTLPSTRQQSHPHRTSTFGRIIKPTRWYIEQADV